ncbi:hypothetical protein ADL21_02935 [Streptomyces albus subsp. albus]|nr:hypothetical protein ADL21_02935 [Streptomyces albus subsp. albus]
MSQHRPEAATPSQQSSATAALFGRRLQRLIDAASARGARGFSDARIAAYVGVTGQYVRNLRRGKSVPSVEKAQKLAELFGVEHADYFLRPDDDPQVLEVERRFSASGGATVSSASPAEGEEPLTEDALWGQLRDEHGVQEIAMRAGQLSPEARIAVLGVVEQLLRSENRDSGPARP